MMHERSMVQPAEQGVDGCRVSGVGCRGDCQAGEEWMMIERRGVKREGRGRRRVRE
jgi:hypothetical protein